MSFIERLTRDTVLTFHLSTLISTTIFIYDKFTLTPSNRTKHNTEFKMTTDDTSFPGLPYSLAPEFLQ